MRFVRRASLVFSLVLIVAIAVGYVARRSQLAGERDARLTTEADLGSAQLGSLIDVVETAALAGTDPAVTTAALSAAYPSLGICSVGGEAVDCGGNGPQVDPVLAKERRAALATGGDAIDGDANDGGADVVIDDTILMIGVDGPDVSVIARTPANVIPLRSGVSVSATTRRPTGVPLGGFAVEDGTHQTTIRVAGINDLYVVATLVEAAELPADEQLFYVLIFSLAVTLLLLAGATLVGEQRNLLERASFDPLTRLPNRGEFERRATEALAAAERTDSQLCVLLFDLNGFKLINDTYGHNAGDEMLKVIGARLRKAVRGDDIVARWGGDEFVVAMPGIESEEMGARRARQLAEEIGGRTRLEGVAEPLRVKVSVGVAVWPDHGSGLDDLIEAADGSMYQAKREGLVCRVASPGDSPISSPA